MKNLRVSSKLLVGFGVAVVFTLVAGIVGIVELNKLYKGFDFAINYHGKPLQEAANMLGGINAMRTELRTAIIFKDDQEKLKAQMAMAEDLTKDFEKNAALYSPWIVDPKAKALFDETMEAYEKTFKPAFFEIIAGAQKGKPVAELVALMAAAKPSTDVVVKNLKEISVMKSDLLDKASEDGAAAKNASLIVLLSVMFASAGISAVLGVYISKQITKPLNETVAMITEMGQGNLSDRLNIDRKDEIGVLAKTMDTFASNLQIYVLDIMKQIAGGDLSAKVGAKGSKDEIAVALCGMLDSLNSVIGTMKQISEGDLSAKIELKSDKDEAKRRQLQPSHNPRLRSERRRQRGRHDDKAHGERHKSYKGVVG